MRCYRYAALSALAGLALIATTAQAATDTSPEVMQFNVDITSNGTSVFKTTMATLTGSASEALQQQETPYVRACQRAEPVRLVPTPPLPELNSVKTGTQVLLYPEKHIGNRVLLTLKLSYSELLSRETQGLPSAVPTPPCHIDVSDVRRTILGQSVLLGPNDALDLSTTGGLRVHIQRADIKP